MKTVFRTLFGSFLILICLLPKVEAQANELIEIKAKIEQVRQSLSGMNVKLQKLKKRDSFEISQNSNFSATEDLWSSPQKKPNEVITESSKTYDESHVRKSVGFDPSGFYILPFLGILSSGNLSLKPPPFSEEFEIEEGVGTSHGLSIGYEGRNFFSDIQISYIQNRMKSMNLPIPLSFSGKSEAWGIHVTGGGRVYLNQFFSFSIGAGIGGVDQRLSLLLGGSPVEEEDFLLSYQIFSGLEVRPVDSTSMGLRYRWLHIDKMDIFSSRDLHLIELWFGYLF